MDNQVTKLMNSYNRLKGNIKILNNEYELAKEHKTLTPGKLSSLSARLAIQRSSLKSTIRKLQECWKGNIIYIKFSVVGPNSEIFETTLTNMTEDEAVKLIELKYQKIHIIESKNFPTQIKKVGL